MITVPSQHTEAHITRSMARSSITAAQLIRWSGLANILAGILYALETLLHPARDITKLAAITQQSVLGVSWQVSHTLGIAAGLLGLLGLIGLYVRQFDKLGGLGLIGFVTTLIGTAMLAATLVPDAYVFPVLGSHPATALCSALQGHLVRTGSLSRQAASPSSWAPHFSALRVSGHGLYRPGALC